MFYFVCVKSNELTQATVEQKHLYSELLGEYRTLKRQAFLAEKEARYEERTKIARDLHDSVGHKITALLMQLEILFHQHGAEKYKELKKLANESLQETRKAVKALSHEEQEGFSTILHLIKKLESESHILVQLTTKGGVLSTKLTNVESVVLYRVIQEGLTNAMRHANSREVQVILGKNPVGEIEFAIMNKVHGVETFQEGFGIKSMRERVLSLGGSLSVYIASDQFIVKGQFPVQDHNQ